MTDTSRSPNSVSASVRGIGVAVMMSTCGASPVCLSANRWFTPKRCCSSMIASESFLKLTLSWISACVPTTRSISPCETRFITSSRCAFGMLPVTRPTRTPIRSSVAREKS